MTTYSHSSSIPLTRVFIIFVLLKTFDNLEGKLCSCTQPWITFQSSCYLFAPLLKYHNDAEDICVLLSDTGRDSHLVSIHSLAENDFVADNVNNIFGGRSAHIGLTFINETLRWTDDSLNDFENWQINTEPVSDCVRITVSNGEWDDSVCNVKRPFVCKK